MNAVQYFAAHNLAKCSEINGLMHAKLSACC